MSRSADAHVMDKENEDHMIRDLTPTKDRFRSSSSHSSLKDHADSSHDVPLVGNISPFKHKSSKIRKDLFDNRSSKTSSPKRDKSAIAKLVRNKSWDCDSEKSNLKSNPIQEKDGDHLIIDELENEKTQTVTTPGVAPEDLHGFEVHSSEKKDSPIKRLLDYKKESENRTAIAQKSALPETGDKFLRDPILQRLKNMTPGTYLPKSYSESNLKSSQLRDRLKSEVPRSDSAPSDSRIKSLSNVVKFSKESIKEGNSASTTTLLGLKSQTNLAKKENKISESPENGNKDDLSLSSSTEKAPKSNKSKSESKSREVQSAPAAAGQVTSQVTGHVTSELQLEERGAADGESPRQVVSEGNPEEGNPLVNGDVIIPGESQHNDNEALPSASQSHSQSDAQRDLDKKFAEKVSLRLSSINLTPEKDKSSGGNLSGADPPSIGREKLKIDLNWDSSSHSISSNSGRHDSNDREVQSLNLGRTRNLASIPAGQVDNVNSGVMGETSQLVRATVDLALLNDVEEDSQDPSLPQPRPPAAPAPRKASKVMAAR